MEALTEGLAEQSVAVADMSTLLRIDDESGIGAARRCAVALGNGHGIGTEALGRLAIIVTEAATNILRHAGHGTIVLRTLGSGATGSVEMLALDKGAGIHDVARAMQDGFSTGGTAGQGLGGIKRLSDVFDMHSQRTVGTAVLARVEDRPGPGTPSSRAASIDDRIGAVCVPLRGETKCGDAWRVLERAPGLAVMLVDGLGHGPEAATAASAATTAFERLAETSSERTLARLDDALRGTRGAALSLALIDETASAVQFGGVGNVEARIVGGGPTVHLVPQTGIVGYTMPALRPCISAWPANCRLVLHSDGISSRWRLDDYPGLMTAHPALIAGVIFRDFSLARDDATVLVLSGGSAPVPA